MIVAIQSEPLKNGEIYREFSIISLLTSVHNVNFNLFCWFSLHFQDVFFLFHSSLSVLNGKTRT